jgi:acyl carrier protein
MKEMIANDSGNNAIHASLSEEDRIAIQTIVMEKLEVDRSQVTPDALIVEDLIADSLDVIDITMMLEEHFDVTIPDARADQIRTVADLYDAVAGLLPKNRLRL